MPRAIAAAIHPGAPASPAAAVTLHVSPDRQRRVITVHHGHDRLVVRTTGYHPLRSLAAAFAQDRAADRDAAIQAMEDSIVGATGLQTDHSSSVRDLLVPVPAQAPGLPLLMAVAIQKVCARGGAVKVEDLDFAHVAVRQGRRGTYLVEVRRWCSQATAAFMVRRLPSSAHADSFEIRF